MVKKIGSPFRFLSQKNLLKKFKKISQKIVAMNCWQHLIHSFPGKQTLFAKKRKNTHFPTPITGSFPPRHPLLFAHKRGRENIGSPEGKRWEKPGGGMQNHIPLHSSSFHGKRENPLPLLVTPIPILQEHLKHFFFHEEGDFSMDFFFSPGKRGEWASRLFPLLDLSFPFPVPYIRSYLIHIFNHPSSSLLNQQPFLFFSKWATSNHKPPPLPLRGEKFTTFCTKIFLRINQKLFSDF